MECAWSHVDTTEKSIKNIKIDLKSRLIEEVKKYKFIWDRHDKNHHNRTLLRNSWRRIAQSLNCDFLVAKATWKYLRQEFSRRIKNSARPGDEYLEPTSWPHYESMMFMKDQFDGIPAGSIGPRQFNFAFEIDSSNSTEPNGPSLQDQGGPTQVAMAFNDPLKDQVAIPPFNDPLQDQASIPLNEPSSSVTASSESDSNTEAPPRRVKRKRSQESQVSTLQKSIRALQKEKEELKFDDDVAFFNSIMPHVKKLDSLQKLRFRIEVTKLMYDMLFGSNGTTVPEVTEVKVEPTSFQ